MEGQLDVRHLGRHLGFTDRARAGTLSCRVKEATAGVAAVGALPLGFQVKLGLVRGKFIPAGLHAAEASNVFASLLSAFRAAIVRAVWSSKMPWANTLAVLNMHYGPVGVDPALHIIRVRFRMVRRYLAYCLDEEPRIFRMSALISRRAQGHGPVHLLLISAAQLGFAWDGEEKGWVRVSLPPLRMMAGPIQHFLFLHSGCLTFWYLCQVIRAEGLFWELSMLIYNYLPLPICGKEIKCCSEPLCVGEVWNGFLLGKAKKEDVPCRFCGMGDGDGHLF